MPSAEAAFEYLALALETTPGTAIAAPTHYLPIAGNITPNRDKYRPEESRGTLAQNYRSKTVRAGAAWQGSGGLDVNYLPLVANLFVKGGVTSPSTPGGAVNARLWTFTPTVTADDLKTATLFYGDPNVQIWQAAYGIGQTLTIDADASGTDGAQWSMSGRARFPVALGSPPALPAQNIGSLLMPGAMQLWIDTSSAIGTTEIEGRFISTSWEIPTGTVEKYYAGGTAGGLNFTKHGRGRRSATATITVELNDLSLAAEYAQWEADTSVKMRIRINGGIIDTGPDFYEYAELDIYGPLDAFDWGLVENTNRTMQFTVTSEYDTTLGADFSLKAQNSRTAL